MNTITRPTILLFLAIVSACAISLTFGAICIALLMIPVIALIVDLINSDMNSVNLFCGIAFSFTMKRIKTDHGRFYVIIKPKENRVLLMYDRFFYLENIGYTSYYGDLESLKKWVKETIVTKTAAQKLTDSIKSWNGCLDKTSERNQKLNEIL